MLTLDADGHIRAGFNGQMGVSLHQDIIHSCDVCCVWAKGCMTASRVPSDATHLTCLGLSCVCRQYASVSLYLVKPNGDEKLIAQALAVRMLTSCRVAPG